MPNFTSMETLNEPEAYVPYRKHSSGDLQSRLKTRKILGVGETDNGDVHRSKISQVLGHNEHLFVKLPRCYWFWHFCMAFMFTLGGTTHFLIPYAQTESSSQKDPRILMMGSMYGSILLSIAVLLWIFIGTTDKAIARGLMSAIVTAMLAQLVALLTYAYQNRIWDSQLRTDLGIRMSVMAISIYFFWAIGSSRAGLRKSLSNKDLREKVTPDDQQPSPVSPTAKKTE